MSEYKFSKRFPISSSAQRDKRLEVILSGEESRFRAAEMRKAFEEELGLGGSLRDENEAVNDMDETFFLIGRDSQNNAVHISDDEMVDLNDYVSFELAPRVVGG